MSPLIKETILIQSFITKI